ncbi:MAG: hypothetical protein IJC79_03110 [Clostridia bacterium]|nr:hypothetical protein [Clostridia bacterium]
MKKLLSILLTISILFTMTSFAFAEETPTMMSIADEVIDISVSVDISGNEVFTYDNIDIFINAVRNELPDLTDAEIAQFIMLYTGQEQIVPIEDAYLFVLEFKSITTTKTYISTTSVTDDRENIATPLASWESNDGAMTITTNYGLRKTVNGNKYFSVYANAWWEDFPFLRTTDVLAIGSNAVYDDSYDENGYVNQIFYCEDCKEFTTMYSSVSGDNRISGNAEMLYENLFPYIEFNSYTARCNNCNIGDVDDNMFNVFLNFGIIVPTVANIQAGYGHTTFGLTGISVSISADKVLSISGNFGTVVKDYIAEAVTVQ